MPEPWHQVGKDFNRGIWVYPQRARLIFEDFDWEDDRPLETPLADLVIYELHTRSFTAHPSAGVKHPGTYAGIIA